MQETTTPAADSSDAPETLHAAALRYAACGIKVFPLQPRSKKPNGVLCNNGFKGATTDAQQIDAWWTNSPDANIGVPCSSNGWVALDIDPRNGGFESVERLEAQHGAFPSDVMAFTGGGGEHRVFSTALTAGFPGEVAKGVDVKFDGYLVVEPSIHPNGRRYEWEASSDPRDGIVPPVCPSWVYDSARAHGSSTAHLAQPGPSRPVEAARWADVLDALPFVPSQTRAVWLDVGMAIHAENPTAEGYALWSSWSQTCPSKFDPQDQIRVWRSFTRRGIMGKTLNTVFDLAKKSGWNPRKQTALSVDFLPTHPAHVGLIGLSDPVPEVQIKEEVAAALPPFPSGGLNELAAWFDRAFESTHPRVSQAAALMVASIAASRRYESVFGDPASVFMGMIGPTISATRYALDGIEQVMVESGLRAMVRTTRITSPQQLYTTINRSPAGAYLSADYGDLLRFAKRQPSGLIDSVLHLLSTDVASGKTVQLDDWSALGQKQPEGALAQPILYRPAWGLVALLSGAQVATAFKRSELSRGALDSMLFIHAPSPAWVDSARAEPPLVPAASIERVRELRALSAGEVGNRLLESAGTEPTLIKVGFPVGLADIERAWIAEYKQRGPIAKVMAQGARRMLRRVALVVAAWINPRGPFVTDDVLTWSAQFVKSCLEDALAHYNGADDDAKPDVYQSVLEVITDRGTSGIPQGSLHSYCRAFRALDKEKRADLVAKMLSDEAIVSIKVSSNNGSRLVAASFVEQKKDGA